MEVKQKIHGVNRVGLSGAFGPSVCFMNQQTWVTALLCGLCVSPQRPFESLCAAALALRVHRAQDKNRREQNSARGKPFRRFKKWLEEQPPYDIVIDGANVTRLKVMTD